MKLHLDPENFKLAIASAAEALGIKDLFIEKDYWVSYVLKQLSTSKFKDQVVFKGGTSLSKAYNLVNRFSEDIDLVLLSKAELSGGQIKKLLSNIEEAIICNPLETAKDFRPSKGSKIRKTGYTYPKMLDSYHFGHVNESLILELNAFANPSPVVTLPIESYIGRSLRLQKRHDVIAEYELEPFDMKILDVSRTFTEKVLSLARISINDDEQFSNLQQKIRHFYDIHQILVSGTIKDFLNSAEFKDTVDLVIKDDLTNPEFRDDWKGGLLHEVRLFKDTDMIFDSLTTIFHGPFADMLYDDEKTKLTEIRKSFELLKSLVFDFKIKGSSEVKSE